MILPYNMLYKFNFCFSSGRLDQGSSLLPLDLNQIKVIGAGTG